MNILYINRIKKIKKIIYKKFLIILLIKNYLNI